MKILKMKKHISQTQVYQMENKQGDIINKF